MFALADGSHTAKHRGSSRLKSIYDVVIIGGGSAGLTGARFAANLGARVALVEKHRVGGDCTWTGCVPSKALIRAAKAAHEVRHAGRFGVEAAPPVVDMAGVRSHVRAAIEHVYSTETPEVLTAEGIELVTAPAEFIDARTIRAGDRTISARRFVICTGARPAIPPIPGLADVSYLTHETIFENERLPRHLLVLGAGPIGVEIAQAYRRLGAAVSVIGNELLPRAEQEVSGFVAEALEAEDVAIRLGAVDEISMNDGEYQARCGDHVVRGDMLLVATGRRPNVEGLGLEAAGIAGGPRGIEVDRYLRSSNPRVYAAGDVVGGLQFTHLAGWQGFQAVRNALLPGRSVGMPVVVPSVIFLDPEVASVGMTEAEARDRHGERVGIHHWDMVGSDRAVADGQTSGFIKVVAGAGGEILGATVVAARAGEMIGEFTLALTQGFGLSELAETVHAYPTWSTPIQLVASTEAVNRFLSSTSGRIARRLSGL